MKRAEEKKQEIIKYQTEHDIEKEVLDEIVSLSNNLYHLRASLEFSMQEFAEMCGISKTLVRQIECIEGQFVVYGNKRGISISTLLKISKSLNIPLTPLFSSEYPSDIQKFIECYYKLTEKQRKEMMSKVETTTNELTMYDEGDQYSFYPDY